MLILLAALSAMADEESDPIRDEVMGMVVHSCAASYLTRFQMDNPDEYVPSTYELISAIPAEIERLIEDVRAALQPGMDMWERRDIYAQFAEACDKEFGLFTPIEELFGR